MLIDMGLIVRDYDSDTSNGEIYKFTHWLWKYVYYRMPLIR